MQSSRSIALTLTLCAGSVAMAAPADDAKIAFFEKNVRPILIKRCYECHSA